MTLSDSSNPSIDLTLGIIGCGSLGTSILNGLLEGTSTAGPGDTLLPQQFIVNVRSETSVSRLNKAWSQRKNVKVLQGQNVRVATQSTIIILGVPPSDISSVLNEEGMRDALHEKLLISLAAGVPRSKIESIVQAQSSTANTTTVKCCVVRALPNLAASVRKSITGLEFSEEDVPPENTVKLVDKIFEQIGTIVHLPASQMDACTALCGSTPAYFALFVDALIDGSIVAGVPRDKAQFMAIQALVGTGALLQSGMRPSALREEVCAMPGCTVAGNMTLEQGGVRGIIAKAIQDAIIKASQLG